MKSRATLKTIIESIPEVIGVPIIVADDRGTIVYANSSAEEALQDSYKTISKKSAEELFGEIDNFSKSNRPYGQEFTQSILKKVAFTISLHQKSTDVIARTDYNQFTIILSRPSREQSFKDIDLIRQSISEMDFKSSETGNIKVTVSGGFVIKPSNTTLDEATRQAKRILEFSKEHGVNKISQARDLANNEL